MYSMYSALRSHGNLFISFHAWDRDVDVLLSTVALEAGLRNVDDEATTAPATGWRCCSGRGDGAFAPAVSPPDLVPSLFPFLFGVLAFFILSEVAGSFCPCTGNGVITENDLKMILSKLVSLAFFLFWTSYENYNHQSCNNVATCSHRSGSISISISIRNCCQNLEHGYGCWGCFLFKSGQAIFCWLVLNWFC